ncbi:MAG: hypothetical protein RLZZ557_599 [Bacteroidota bacterium]|jgi:hypothetical protein
MRKSILFLFVASTLVASCGKPKTPTPTPPTPPVEVEENIAFSLDPDPGATTITALAGTHSFKVNVTSKLPSSGVSIDVATKKESDGSVLESKNIKSTVAANDVTIGTLVSGVLYNVTVVVSSQKTSTNSQTKTFKIARK